MEVDTNVTRHLRREMDQRDWDMMILHYLGLDHVGHSEGPNSPLMYPKQVEMDGIIKDIYTTIQTSSTKDLFLVCGDHGMNQIGNHGGTSDEETNTAMMLLSNINISSNITESYCAFKLLANTSTNRYSSYVI